MLSNRVVLITGGAGLLGKEFVQAVVENDGIAIIADINEQGREVKDELSKELNTTNIDFVKLDITSKDSLISCIKYLDKKYKRIDALVNNAYPRNKNYAKHFFDVEYEDFVENVGLNLGGYFTASQQFAKYFQKQGYGNILNISSIYGVIAPKFEIYDNTTMTMPVEYAAIKSGLIHLTKYMAKYFKGMNIKVNSLSPGGIFDNQPEAFLEKYKEWEISTIDLDDLEMALERVLMNILQNNDFEAALPDIILMLESYNHFLYMFEEFDELSKVVYAIVILLRDLEFNNVSNQVMVSRLIVTTLQDLVDWKEVVFIDQNVDDVYYINDAILNSYVQIQDLIS